MNDDRAVVVQVARLPFLAGDGGANPTPRLHFTTSSPAEVSSLLAAAHYLGPVNADRITFAGWVDDVLVACQVWRWPSARMLPTDGTLLELSRWCLTSEAGRNAGSKMMRWAARRLREAFPVLVAGVSYSDPARHSGALYKASGWRPWPTHHEERFNANGVGYPSGHGSWDGKECQGPKRRWRYVFKEAADA